MKPHRINQEQEEHYSIWLDVMAIVMIVIVAAYFIGGALVGH